jgi:hypothetical protein
MWLEDLDIIRILEPVRVKKEAEARGFSTSTSLVQNPPKESKSNGTTRRPDRVRERFGSKFGK